VLFASGAGVNRGDRDGTSLSGTTGKRWPAQLQQEVCRAFNPRADPSLRMDAARRHCGLLVATEWTAFGRIRIYLAAGQLGEVRRLPPP
jgi:hypothetical protein